MRLMDGLKRLFKGIRRKKVSLTYDQVMKMNHADCDECLSDVGINHCMDCIGYNQLKKEFQE